MLREVVRLTTSAPGNKRHSDREGLLGLSSVAGEGASESARARAAKAPATETHPMLLAIKEKIMTA